MFGSVVIDVAIGMAFVYLLLSLIATVVQEIIAAFLQLRPENLLRGIRSLFSGDSWNGKDLVDSLYDHGLIRGLYSDPVKDLTVQADSIIKTRRERTVECIRSWLQARIKLRRQKDIAGVSQHALLPAYIPSRSFAVAMVDILNGTSAPSDNTMESILRSLADNRTDHPENKAGQAMYALALNAKGDIVAFQKNLENWYNDSMDRASGWYKRYIQQILLMIGLLLAVTFNVDSVRVARTLWFDRDSRQAMVNAADAYLKKHPDPPQPAIAANTTPPDPSSQASSPHALSQKLQESAQAFDQVTNSALLPVGWKQTPGHYLASGWSYMFQLHGESRDNETVFGALWRCFELLLGWLITGLAISMGAPFWFDILNKFMVVRSTIKPQEKSQTEPSKD